MMLLGRLHHADASMECLVGVEKTRVVVVAQDDLSRFVWPVDDVRMDPSMRGLILSSGDLEYQFVPDLPDRFRWVMTAALQEAAAHKTPWWRRVRSAPAPRTVSAKLQRATEAA